MRERKILLIGVLPPVLAFTLLRPYPPKAGNAMNKPPAMFATPSATSSLLALRFTFLIVSSFPPRLFAATVDSKKPSSAMMKDVLNASEAYLRCDVSYGKCTGKGRSLLCMSPKMSRPFASQENFHVRTAERTTTRKRSGT